MAAFRGGIEAGADWIELDIHLTSDGQLVVLHDLTTKRVGNIDLNVAKSTYSQLLHVDVATDFRRRNLLNDDDCPAAQIPLLEEVLRLVMQQNRTRASLQPKADCVREAIDLIEKLGAGKWVGFNDGNLNYMSQVKQLSPGIPVFWDRPDNTDLKSDLVIAKERGFESIVVNVRGMNAAKIQQIHDAGLQAGAWTVNDAVTMKRLLDAGIDRIYTDDPALLLKERNALRR